MNENKQELLKIETELQALMKERGELIAKDRPLTAAEVDRIFNLNIEIDRCFEWQSMLLPLVEEKETQDRWNSPGTKMLKEMFPKL